MLTIAALIALSPMNLGVQEFGASHAGYYCDPGVLDDAESKGWKYVSQVDINDYTRQTYRRGNETLVIDVGSMSQCIVQKYRNGRPLLKRGAH
jgi:hypothetical protein